MCVVPQSFTSTSFRSLWDFTGDLELRGQCRACPRLCTIHTAEASLPVTLSPQPCETPEHCLQVGDSCRPSKQPTLHCTVLSHSLWRGTLKPVAQSGQWIPLEGHITQGLDHSLGAETWHHVPYFAVASAWDPLGAVLGQCPGPQLADSHQILTLCSTSDSCRSWLPDPCGGSLAQVLHSVPGMSNQIGPWDLEDQSTSTGRGKPMSRS